MTSASSSGFAHNFIPDGTFKKSKYILITNGESYVGHTLAMHIADQLTRREGRLKKKHWRVRVLCENKENLKDLEKRGIEVREVDYKSQSMLREQMKDHIKTIIFNPFAKQPEVFMNHGKNVIEAAAHEKIKRILMISANEHSSSADKDTPIDQFKMLEEHLRQSFKYGEWAVFRISFIQQYLYFWTDMIESKSCLGMPLPEDSVLETVNLKDVVDCVAQASLSKKSVVWCQPNQNAASGSDDSSDENDVDLEKIFYQDKNITLLKRVYEIKSTMPMTPWMIAEALSIALKEEGYDADVKFTTISEEQLESYLKCLSESCGNDIKVKIESLLQQIFGNAPVSKPSVATQSRRNSSSGISGTVGSFKSMLSTGSKIDSCIATTPGQDDPSWLPCPSEVLTPFCIKLIIDHFRVASFVNIPSIPSNDVRDILGRDPIHINEFFMKNRRQFRPEFH